MGLLDAFKQYIRDAMPGGLLNPEVPPGGPTELAKGLLGFTPVVGDAISGYDAIQSARQGDYLGAALNGVGLLPFVPAMGGMVKGAAHVDKKSLDMQKLYQQYKNAFSDIATDTVLVGPYQIRKVSYIPDLPKSKSTGNQFNALGFVSDAPHDPDIRLISGLSEKDFIYALEHELDHLNRRDFPSFTKEYPDF